MFYLVHVLRNFARVFFAGLTAAVVLAVAVPGTAIAVAPVDSQIVTSIDVAEMPPPTLAVPEASGRQGNVFWSNSSSPEVCVTLSKPTRALSDLVITRDGVVIVNDAELTAQRDAFCFAPSSNGLKEGTHRVRLQSVTRGKQVRLPSIVLKTDYTPPVLPSPSGGTAAPARWGNPSDVTVKLTGEPGSSWGFVLDGGSYRRTSTPLISLSNLAPGFHLLWIISSDASGNFSLAPMAFGVGQEPRGGCDSDEVSDETRRALHSQLKNVVALTAFAKDYLYCHPEQAILLRGPSYISQENALPSGRTVETSLIPHEVADRDGIATTRRNFDSSTLPSIASASACKTDRRRSGTVGMYYFYTSVRFCYNGRHVTWASTSRSFNVTTAGNIAGYRIDLWEDPIRFYYSLNSVPEAAYRYTQGVRWSFGRPWAFQCTTTHTQRVYGTGRTTWAWNKDC